jgi:hypothetical protein
VDMSKVWVRVMNNSLRFQKPYDILYMWQSNEKLDAGERTRIK